MIGASLSFSVIQACLPGLLFLRASPLFSLLTKRIPTRLLRNLACVGEGLSRRTIQHFTPPDPPDHHATHGQGGSGRLINQVFLPDRPSPTPLHRNLAFVGETGEPGTTIGLRIIRRR